MPIVVPLVALAVLAGAGAVAWAVTREREPSTVIAATAKVMPPPRAEPPPPARARAPAEAENLGVDTCSFGIASHCYWTPKVVKPLGLHTFEWGFCLARWKDDLAREEKGGIKVVDAILNGVLAIASALTLGLSQEAIERLCFRFKWKLRSYEIGGATYWAIRYISPEKHIATGEIVKPPPNPTKDGAWVHVNDPGDYAGGARWTVPVFSVFFQRWQLPRHGSPVGSANLAA